MTTVGVKHDQVVRYSKRKKVKVDYTMYDTLTKKKDEAFIKTLLEQKFSPIPRDTKLKMLPRVYCDKMDSGYHF